MSILLTILTFVIRFFIILKIIYLLYTTRNNFDQVNEFVWWILCLVFDIWLNITLKITPENKEGEK
mgnify:CR=1